MSLTWRRSVSATILKPGIGKSYETSLGGEKVKDSQETIRIAEAQRARIPIEGENSLLTTAGFDSARQDKGWRRNKKTGKHPPLPLHRVNLLQLLALLGLCGPMVFAAVVVVLPYFRLDEYSSLRDPVSALLLGRYGYIQTAAFFAAGLSSIAVAVGIRRTMRGSSRGSRLGIILIELWAVGFMLAGILPTDAEGQPTQAAASFHASVAFLAFVGAVAGILTLSKRFAGDGRWRSFYPLSLAIGFATLVGLVDLIMVMHGLIDQAAAIELTTHNDPRIIGMLSQGFEGFGIIQRIFLGTVMLWVILAAGQLHSIARNEQPY